MKNHLDPQNEAFAEAISGEPAPHVLGYVKVREALEVLQKHEPAPDIMTETIKVPGEDGSFTDMVIFRPKSATKPCHMVFYTHGGGWILGSPASFAPLMEDLARQSEAAMVFPCYTAAPEKQYPFQFEQTYKALDYIVRNGHKHNILVESIALAGDSVGGHMAIAMMQMPIERNLPARIGQMILFYPVTDTRIKMESYETFKDGPFLPVETMDWMIDAFLPNKKDRETALASPLSFLADEVLSKFPPTTIFLSDMDPLIDEGRAFGHRLQKVGVDAAVIRAEGQIHAFVLAKPIRQSAAARAMVELAACKMRKAFSS
ncbi:vegetative specific protein H5 [Macrophomina phaseolina]|uniref:Vegetative specific protein H5 n=1 Tax=Macrophomina phaseolina TaxID=35725 RepID=A0ABQ8FV26_9PEZI|nr:vegetative specific protein H5 [Macrophomina phaseolina]